MDVSKIVDMGFTPQQAQQALNQTGNDLEKAVELLVGGSVVPTPASRPQSQGPQSQGPITAYTAQSSQHSTMSGQPQQYDYDNSSDSEDEIAVYVRQLLRPRILETGRPLLVSSRFPLLSAIIMCLQTAPPLRQALLKDMPDLGFSPEWWCGESVAVPLSSHNTTPESLKLEMQRQAAFLSGGVTPHRAVASTALLEQHLPNSALEDLEELLDIISSTSNLEDVMALSLKQAGEPTREKNRLMIELSSNTDFQDAWDAYFWPSGEPPIAIKSLPPVICIECEGRARLPEKWYPQRYLEAFRPFVDRLDSLRHDLDRQANETVRRRMNLIGANGKDVSMLLEISHAALVAAPATTSAAADGGDEERDQCTAAAAKLAALAATLKGRRATLMDEASALRGRRNDLLDSLCPPDKDLFEGLETDIDFEPYELYGLVIGEEDYYYRVNNDWILVSGGKPEHSSISTVQLAGVSSGHCFALYTKPAEYPEDGPEPAAAFLERDSAQLLNEVDVMSMSSVEYAAESEGASDGIATEHVEIDSDSS